MAKKVELWVPKTTREKLAKMATEVAEGGISPDKLAEVLLDTFFDGKGKFYSARWKEGPGVRILADWPRFSSGVVKIKAEDMR
ncbi:hypothetical protein ACFLT4_05295 [Chloroflexota bacterium]